MKKDLTELVFIMDKSGSMSGLESDAVGGFNSMIQKQSKDAGEALVSTVLFSTDMDVIYDRINIKETPKMTLKDYTVGGCTALMDAIGRSIHHIANVHKYIRDEDKPEHTMFIIMTDGMENASHQYSSDEVKQMISHKKELGWEFVFMAANIDAVETAESFGIEEDNCVNYINDGAGIQSSMDAMDEAILMVRCGKRISKEWKEKAESDYNNRKGE